MKPVLLGMNNPYGPRAEFALYPDPPGCAGHRLWRLLCEAVPTCTPDQYLAAFDRRNLLTGRRWTDRAARAAAPALWASLQGRRVVVLGAANLRALSLPRTPPGVWQRELLIEWCALPHPSGRCRWYYDPACRAIAVATLEELYLSTLPPAQ